MSAAVERLRRGVRRHGVVGAARRVVSIAVEAVYARSEHVWYALPLDGTHRRLPLDPAFTLFAAGEPHLSLLDELWAIDSHEARRRLTGGGTLWLVVDGDAPVFSCWTFTGQTPVRAAPGGWLVLPARTVCLEESLTAPGYRGRGVAPAAWSAIADRLQGSFDRIVTTIENENLASRRAVEKVGFCLIADMVAVKILGRYRVAAGHQDEATAFLEGLEHR